MWKDNVYLDGPVYYDIRSSSDTLNAIMVLTRILGEHEIDLETNTIFLVTLKSFRLENNKLIFT